MCVSSVRKCFLGFLCATSTTSFCEAASTFIPAAGVTATGGYNTASLERLIDGSGLTVFNETGTHDWTADVEWQGIGESGTLRFDLGSTVALDGVYLWNQEVANGAVNAFHVVLRSETDAVLHTSGTFNATIGAPTGATPSEFFALPVTNDVRFVELNVESLHPTTINRTVLAEVGFSAVPEPSSVSILMLAMVVSLFQRRK